MVRRYDEEITVREAATSEPTGFTWRGRGYAVRSVLGHWRERRAWWLEGATARLLGLDGADAETGSGVGAAPVADVLEREVWRVEAAAEGRSSGVFDLSRDDRGEPSPDPAAGPARWRLLQVAD